jgi:valyl-tRNA synthetase
MISPFPEARIEDRDPEIEESMGLVMDLITAIRNLRTELGLPPASRVKATLVSTDPDITAAIKRSSDQVSRLARLDTLEFSKTRSEKEGASAAVVRGQEVLVKASEDLDRDAEKDRLNKELDKVRAEIERIEKKLKNPQFVEKAPAEVVRKNRDIMQQLTSQKDKLMENLERLDA